MVGERFYTQKTITDYIPEIVKKLLDKYEKVFELKLDESDKSKLLDTLNKLSKIEEKDKWRTIIIHNFQTEFQFLHIAILYYNALILIDVWGEKIRFRVISITYDSEMMKKHNIDVIDDFVLWGVIPKLIKCIVKKL